MIYLYIIFMETCGICYVNRVLPEEMRICIM